MFELKCARSYSKPVLAVKPFGYAGGIPHEIALADNQSGPVGFHAPAIIRKVCVALDWQIPIGL